MDAGHSTAGLNQASTAEPQTVNYSTNAILVRRVQKGNPIMDHLKSVPWKFDDILADFEVGRTTGVLFLSLKYHRLHPEYCYGRIQALEKRYMLRVLLLLCDVGDQHEQPIRELTKSCLINEVTILVAWSFEEAALYLQAYKAYENRPPDSIKERVDKDYGSVLRASLTSVKGVNKTDVTTLRTHFGSFARIAHASTGELSNCPGIGPTKVRRLHDAMNQPFRRSSSKPAEIETAHVKTSLSRLRPPAAPRRAMESPEPLNRSGLSSRRSPSPEWDIELDLNGDDEQIDAPRPPPWESDITSASPLGEPSKTNTSNQRYSPDWELEEEL